MLNGIYKILIIGFLISMVFAVVSNLYTGIYQKTNVAEYVKILRNQENVLEGEKISQVNLQKLTNCKENSNCFVDFFEGYNASTTLKNTFSFLSLLMRDYPAYTPYCHQMTHGIGHSELEKQKGKLDIALLEFNKGNYFKNLSTCGSGYYHGLIEAAVKDITKKEDLAKFFKETCNNSIFKDIDRGDCLHGLGHAVITQTGKVEDSIYVCDQTVTDDYNRFNCYTGIFMQMYIDLPYNLIIEKIKKGNTEEYKFPICDSLGNNDLAKRACYFEQSLAFTGYVQTKTELGKDYGEAIKLCQNIIDTTFRLACVKNFSIRSFIDVGYTDINKMCIQNTKTKAERIYCVSAYAHRLALSITGGKKGKEYEDISLDICKNLNVLEIGQCQKLILEKSPSLYLVSKSDLNIR